MFESDSPGQESIFCRFMCLCWELVGPRLCNSTGFGYLVAPKARITEAAPEFTGNTCQEQLS